MPTKRIYTLGPQGTDAHTVAQTLSQHVELCPSFPEAMQAGYATNSRTLICAGYTHRSDLGEVIDVWVDLHFKWFGRMDLTNVYMRAVKPMAIGGRTDAAGSQRPLLAAHSSTQYLVPESYSEAQLLFTQSKPKAVNMVANGQADYCLGSKDVIDSTPNVEILHNIGSPPMVWCLYERRH